MNVVRLRNLSEMKRLETRIAWKGMTRYEAILVLIITIALISFPDVAQARGCHHRADHEICLNRVQCSANYHWCYRVNATLDGHPQPLTRYDCRDRRQTILEGSQKGMSTQFITHGVGNLICTLVER